MADPLPGMTRALLEFPCEAGSIRVARRVLAELIGGADPTTAQVALLLLSELATNSVVHARSDFTVTILVDRDSLRVAVTDGDPHLPVVRHFSRDSVTGRGMQLVDGQSTRWGIEEEDGEGKTVWFELDDWRTPARAVSA